MLNNKKSINLYVIFVKDLFLFQIPLISEKIIPDLRPILCDSSNSEAQRHAAGTLRNLAVGDHHRVKIYI